MFVLAANANIAIEVGKIVIIFVVSRFGIGSERYKSRYALRTIQMHFICYKANLDDGIEDDYSFEY